MVVQRIDMEVLSEVVPADEMSVDDEMSDQN